VVTQTSTQFQSVKEYKAAEGVKNIVAWRCIVNFNGSSKLFKNQRDYDGDGAHFLVKEKGCVSESPPA